MESEQISSIYKILEMWKSVQQVSKILDGKTFIFIIKWIQLLIKTTFKCLQ